MYCEALWEVDKSRKHLPFCCICFPLASVRPPPAFSARSIISPSPFQSPLSLLSSQNSTSSPSLSTPPFLNTMTPTQACCDKPFLTPSPRCEGKSLRRVCACVSTFVLKICVYWFVLFWCLFSSNIIIKLYIQFSFSSKRQKHTCRNMRTLLCFFIICIYTEMLYGPCVVVLRQCFISRSYCSFTFLTAFNWQLLIHFIVTIPLLSCIPTVKALINHVSNCSRQ